MVRRGIVLAVVGLLLAFAYGVPSDVPRATIRTNEAAAQLNPATPGPGGELPAGIAMEPLASGATDALPAAPVRLRFERLAVSPGPSTGSRTTVGPELLYVEAGEVIVVDELGIEGAYPQGTQLLVPMGVLYDIRNNAADPASVLRLSLLPDSPITDSSAGATPSVGIGQLLFDVALKEVPGAPVSIFVSRATWAPGAVFDEHVFSGPIGLVGQEGTLTIAGPLGIEGQLTLGKSVLFPANVPNRERNAGTEPAVVLLAGVTSADQGMVALAEPTPVPVAAAPTTALLEFPTATPVPTAATGVLYEADASGGLDQWSLGAGWKQLNGMLVNDGTAEGAAIFPPYQPVGINDYAVEAEIQFLRSSSRCSENISLGARLDGKGGGYSAGVQHLSCNSRDPSAYIWASGPGQGYLAGVGFNPAGDWHTYRMEVQGNIIRFFIDGTPVLETIDNRYLTGGEVNIATSSAQLSMRRFAIIAL